MTAEVVAREVEPDGNNRGATRSASRHREATVGIVELEVGHLRLWTAASCQLYAEASLQLTAAA